MRQFQKGEKVSRFLRIADVREDGKILDLDIQISELKKEQKTDKWLNVPISDLVIAKEKESPRFEKDCFLKIETTVFDIGDKGVSFDIGGGRFLFMGWEDIRKYWGDEPVPDITGVLAECERIMNEERSKAYIELYASMSNDPRKEIFLRGLSDPKALTQWGTKREISQERLRAKGSASVKFMSHAVIQHLLLSYDGRSLFHGTRFCLDYAISQMLQKISVSYKAFSLWMEFLRKNSLPETTVPDYKTMGEFTRFCNQNGLPIMDSLHVIEDRCVIEMDSITGFARISHYAKTDESEECWLGNLMLPIKQIEDSNFDDVIRKFMRDTALLS